jgi:hypothetical protein
MRLLDKLIGRLSSEESNRFHMLSQKNSLMTLAFDHGNARGLTDDEVIETMDVLARSSLAANEPLTWLWAKNTLDNRALGYSHWRPQNVPAV